MRRLTAAAFVLFVAPAAAETISYPVTIPQECFALAQREGHPTVIENRYQAAKARLKLARLSGKDPMVRDCRAAVNRAKAAYETAGARPQQHPTAHPSEAAMQPMDMRRTPGMQPPGMMTNPNVRTSP